MKLKKTTFDTETTGVMPGSRLIELGAILFDDLGTADVFEQLVNPGMPIPPDATSINAITDDMVKDMPDAGVVLTNFFDWLQSHDSHDLIAHHAQFDTGIITWEAGRFGIQIPDGLMITDTCQMAKSIKATKNNKLITLTEHYELVASATNHRALSDSDLCMQYFNKVKDIATINPVPWDQAGHKYQFTNEFPPMLKNFPELVSTATPISFRYVDAKGNETERTLIPNGWALQNGKLMINGWCELREATRTFRADRVIEVIKSETQAE